MLEGTARTHFRWSDQNIAKLKELWTEGKSAAEISRELGHGTTLTRNAVIGKVHRLGLDPHPRAYAPPTPRKRVRVEVRPSASQTPSEHTDTANGARVTRASTIVRGAAPIEKPAARVPEPKPVRLVDMPKDGRVTVFHLSDKTCKWPIGDPGTEDFCFCGHQPRDGSPYCEYHGRLAYQPLQHRRRRKMMLRILA